MSNLSIENRKKIIETGLYKHKVEPSWVYSNDPYWCKNWTFIPHIYDDGRVFMRDSYFDSSDDSKEVTDENFNEWEFIFDRTKVKRISYDQALEYDEKDLYKYIATDSGGYTCSSCIWVNKDAKKNLDKQIRQAEEHLESAKYQVKWRQEELDKLLKEKDSRKEVEE